MELTRKELYDLVWSEPMTTICRRFGLSDNGLRKRCKSMNIPTPPLGYWAKLKYGKQVTPLPFQQEETNATQSTTLQEAKEPKVEMEKSVNPYKQREQEICSGDISLKDKRLIGEGCFGKVYELTNKLAFKELSSCWTNEAVIHR